MTKKINFPNTIIDNICITNNKTEVYEEIKTMEFLNFKTELCTIDNLEKNVLKSIDLNCSTIKSITIILECSDEALNSYKDIDDIVEFYSKGIIEYFIILDPEKLKASIDIISDFKRIREVEKKPEVIRITQTKFDDGNLSLVELKDFIKFNGKTIFKHFLNSRGLIFSFNFDSDPHYFGNLFKNLEIKYSDNEIGIVNKQEFSDLILKSLEENKSEITFKVMDVISYHKFVNYKSQFDSFEKNRQSEKNELKKMISKDVLEKNMMHREWIERNREALEKDREDWIKKVQSNNIAEEYPQGSGMYRLTGLASNIVPNQINQDYKTSNYSHPESSIQSKNNNPYPHTELKPEKIDELSKQVSELVEKERTSTAKFRSSKVIDGFSTTFRQWRAEGTHCKYLHGYAVSFEIEFEGGLDEKNWVFDFGFGKRLKEYSEEIDEHGNVTASVTNIKSWFDDMFDHTTVIAESDPELDMFRELDGKGIIQLRILPEVGCELFAKFVYDKLSPLVNQDTNGRVRITSVTCRENNKNSATYKID